MDKLITIVDEPATLELDIDTHSKMDLTIEKIVTLVERQHNKLGNLDYASSGHTGFASKEDLENVKNTIQANSFTYNTLTELGNALGIDVSDVKDEYSTSATKINYRGKEINLSNGDTFYIVQSGIPDYWFSLDNMKLYKQETKLDLSIYLTKEEASLEYVNKSELGNYATLDDITNAIGNVSALLGDTEDLEV